MDGQPNYSMARWKERQVNSVCFDNNYTQLVALEQSDDERTTLGATYRLMKRVMIDHELGTL